MNKSVLYRNSLHSHMLKGSALIKMDFKKIVLAFLTELGANQETMESQFAF